MSDTVTNVQLSIIVITYNSDIVKLERTIKSAIFQKNVNFEIIVSDDGSKSDPKNIIKAIFEKYGYTNYRINVNPQNIGTVKNCLEAAKLANGEYIYIISPGDLIFDDYAMADFYNYAKKHNADVCFGDYMGYYVQNNKAILIDTEGRPARPSVFTSEYSLFEKKACFMINESANILGPTYFRKKEYVLKYFEKVSYTSKYVEDNTATAYSFIDNIDVKYYDRLICWYEDFSGISTNEKGNELVNNDFKNTYSFLKKKYQRNRVVSAAYFKRCGKYKGNIKLFYLYLLLLHPVIFFVNLKLKKASVRYIAATDKHIKMLSDKLF